MLKTLPASQNVYPIFTNSFSNTNEYQVLELYTGDEQTTEETHEDSPYEILIKNAGSLEVSPFEFKADLKKNQLFFPPP